MRSSCRIEKGPIGDISAATHTLRGMAARVTDAMSKSDTANDEVDWRAWKDTEVWTSHVSRVERGDEWFPRGLLLEATEHTGSPAAISYLMQALNGTGSVAVTAPTKHREDAYVSVHDTLDDGNTVNVEILGDNVTGDVAAVTSYVA